MTEGEMEGGKGGPHWDKFLSLIKFPPSEPPLSSSQHQHACRYTYTHISGQGRSSEDTLQSASLMGLFCW